MIEGKITDKDFYDYKIELSTYGKLGFAYSTYMDSNPKLYLKNLPDFEEIVNYFLSTSVPFLKLDKKQDICLSLFYNPYFTEFYEMIKKNSIKISRGRKRFLIKHLLSYLADPLQYQGIIAYCDDEREHYIKYDIFNRSKELIDILK